jgi:cobalt-zinc-cadmium resistance protein CzcA
MTENRRIAEETVKIVKEIPDAADVDIMEEPFLPQLQIVADRDKIAQYGLNVADVAELIEVVIGGKAMSQVFICSNIFILLLRIQN